MSRTRTTCLGLALVWLAVAMPRADVAPDEQTILRRIDVSRTLATMKALSEDVVKNRSGAGVGTAVAGSPDEKALADFIEQNMKAAGLAVHQERFPVRHYEYGEVKLTAGGKSLPAVSLHAAGGTWGTRDGVPYARGNDDVDHHRVRAPLVDVGDGFAPDYARAGEVRGKVVLVRRAGGWPTYQFIEAARRGAVALLMYDYPGGRDDTLKQDSMWYHEQLPTVSIRKADAKALLDEMKRGAVDVTLENRIDADDGFSENVIGIVRGSEHPDEWITVSAHHDRWFKAAVDDCSGVASMLELARTFTSAGYRPRRSLMFISFGAEEAGVEATESDWLAGSQAFITQHPEVTRSLALAVNIDVTGWAGEKGALLTTPDNVTFERGILADLGLTNRVSVRPVLSSTTDAWNLGSVGGGAASLMTWVSETGGVFGGGSSFSAIYHTDLDVFDPTHVPNLETDLRIEALAIARADRSVALPIEFSGIASWVEEALKADESKVSDVAFADAHAAVARLNTEATRIERARLGITSATLAAPVNRWLMRSRKDLLPWLIGRGAGGVRTTAYANQLQALSTARASAERGDAAATTTALARLLGAGARVSRETFLDQRLYSYTSGDWSSLFEQRAKPIGSDLYGIYQQLDSGGRAQDEAARLKDLETEVRMRLIDALFLVTGKLNQAARALAETPLPGNLSTEDAAQPVNDRPNPYETVRSWGRLPEGRSWGSTGAVNVDRDGASIWTVERCGSFSWQSTGRVSCADSNLPVVLKFDANGTLVKSFGGGLFIFPHGLHVDRDGNVWVTDARAATANELRQFPDAKGKGHQVVKFSPDGKVLLTLGKPGTAGDPPEFLNEPCDVITAPNGDILVAEGHSGQNNNPSPTTVSRISRFTKDGKFIKSWGKLGSGPGEFKTPHALAFDSRGRLFVADRGNNRVQVFDAEGNFLAAWSQFGRPSDVFVDSNDLLHVADSESGPRYQPGWNRGVRIGRASDGNVLFLISPHQTDRPEGMSGEGVTVDAQGNVFSAEVGTDGGPQAVRGLTKYTKRVR